MLCTNRRAACICGLGRSAALQILAIATAIAAVCALQPIPIRSAGFPLDVCRASLVGRCDLQIQRIKFFFFALHALVNDFTDILKAKQKIV